jgi:hypothetical protein
MALYGAEAEQEDNQVCLKLQIITWLSLEQSISKFSTTCGAKLSSLQKSRSFTDLLQLRLLMH